MSGVFFGCSSRAETWLVIRYQGGWGRVKGSHCVRVFRESRNNTNMFLIWGCFHFMMFTRLWFLIIFPCVSVVGLNRLCFFSSHWLASLKDGMPTCQLFPHNFNRGGFACTFISAPQEFPSSHTCHIENIPPNFLSGFQFAVSSSCHTLSSWLLSPPSRLSLPPIHLHSPPLLKKKKKGPVPCTSLSCTSPSSVYKGSS